MASGFAFGQPVQAAVSPRSVHRSLLLMLRFEEPIERIVARCVYPKGTDCGAQESTD
jgi:hypothetical protein